MSFFFLLIKRVPPRSKRTDTPFPYPTLFRSAEHLAQREPAHVAIVGREAAVLEHGGREQVGRHHRDLQAGGIQRALQAVDLALPVGVGRPEREQVRSEEHTSELQSLMRNSYAVFCLKKKKHNKNRSSIL